MKISSAASSTADYSYVPTRENKHLSKIKELLYSMNNNYDAMETHMSNLESSCGIVRSDNVQAFKPKNLSAAASYAANDDSSFDI
jgi:hypothetical protein